MTKRAIRKLNEFYCKGFKKIVFKVTETQYVC
jgi:hypothetical protein